MNITVRFSKIITHSNDILAIENGKFALGQLCITRLPTRITENTLVHIIRFSSPHILLGGVLRIFRFFFFL